MHHYNYLNWLFKDNSILGFFKRLIILIGSISLIIFLIFKFFLLVDKLNLIYRRNYGGILVHLGTGKSIIALVAFFGVLIMMGNLIKTKIQLSILNRKKGGNKYGVMGLGRGYELDMEKKGFLILSLTFLFIGVYLLTSPIIITKNKIVVKNLIPFLEREHSYDDIKKVKITISRTNKGETLKYIIKTKDDKKININDGNITELLRVNKIIKEKKIHREVDDKYLEVLVVDLNENYKSSYRSLFE